MTSHETDRRRFERRLVDEAKRTARIRPGRDVLLIDLSEGGALIEATHRLLPGSAVELHVADGDRRVLVRGRIVRAVVARIGAGEIHYRGAIAFDGYQLPASNSRPIEGGRAAATHALP